MLLISKVAINGNGINVPANTKFSSNDMDFNKKLLENEYAEAFHELVLPEEIGEEFIDDETDDDPNNSGNKNVTVKDIKEADENKETPIKEVNYEEMEREALYSLAKEKSITGVKYNSTKDSLIKLLKEHIGQ